MTPRRPVRGLLATGLVLSGILAAALLVGPRGVDGPPLDPRSTGPAGTKALVDTLAALGADVRVLPGTPGPEIRTALLLSDLLEEPERARLRAWVDGGGVLVVADPRSELTPDLAGDTAVGFVSATIAKRCELPALRDVERIAAPGGGVYELVRGAPPRETACFPRNDGAWLVAEPIGRGMIVALGGPGALLNEHLAKADNALLAVALLAPDGRGPVAVLPPPGPGEGEATLGELLDPRVRVALWQLGGAFLVVAAWRARRLGRPVLETAPVRIPAAELVVAVGNLLQQARGRSRAAALLRGSLRRALAERAGLPLDAPVDALAAAAAARAKGPDREAVRSALDGPVPATEGDLAQLGREVEHIRRAVLGEHQR
jgi:hypothetical protein